MGSDKHARSRDYYIFFCRLSIIHNPEISLINFDQQQVQLLGSCSVFENKMFPLLVDHLVVGDSGIFRQLLFSMVIFFPLVDQPLHSYFLWKPGFCSIQHLFLSNPLLNKRY